MLLLLRAALIIWLYLLAGKAIATLLPFGFPASILGLILLFISFQVGLVKLDWVKPVADPILTYMALLFIPIGVGLVNYLELIQGQWPSIVACILIGTFAVMTLVGHLFQRFNQVK
ncbi:CidA/LrgA family protein [Motilimonas sp. KMU-193]|uniref:CidA/LrgA family protein n=1 Tax=Motilimonas sp. KMU-193 TaxID=3388668 RepID=UPI00396B3D3F